MRDPPQNSSGVRALIRDVRDPQVMSLCWALLELCSSKSPALLGIRLLLLGPLLWSSVMEMAGPQMGPLEKGKPKPLAGPG